MPKLTIALWLLYLMISLGVRLTEASFWSGRAVPSAVTIAEGIGWLCGPPAQRLTLRMSA